MSYEEEIIERLREFDNWPHFENADILNNLNELADNFFKKNTLEGYLSCLFIYHQITEEMIKLLIDCSKFFIQCSIFPNEYKPKLKNFERKSYGQILADLEKGVLSFDSKKFIEKCRKLNQLRNEMFHKITLKTSIDEIHKQVNNLKIEFDEIYVLFDLIYDNYKVTFHHFKKNIDELEELIED